MRVNNLLKVIRLRVEKVALPDLNLQTTNPETDTLTTQPPSLTKARSHQRRITVRMPHDLTYAWLQRKVFMLLTCY